MIMKNIRKIGLVLLSMVVASLLMIGCGKSNEDELNAAIEMSYKKVEMQNKFANNDYSLSEQVEITQEYIDSIYEGTYGYDRVNKMAELSKEYFETYKKALNCSNFGDVDGTKKCLNRCTELSEEIDDIMYEIRDE